MVIVMTLLIGNGALIENMQPLTKHDTQRNLSKDVNYMSGVEVL